MEKIRKQIVETVKRSKNILLMPSTPVDGDSIGSALALYLIFKKMGKQATVVCADPVPDVFKFLPTTKVMSDHFDAVKDFIVTLDCKKAKINTIRTKLEQDKVNIIITAKKGQFSSKDISFDHGENKYDLIITVDTGDLEQLGRFYEDNTEMFTQVPLINIDHHASNDHFGKINYVDIMSSATTEILIPLIQDFEKDANMKLMDADIATLLLAGIITDTGSFQNANTTPRSFAASALLVKYGARQQEIIQHVFKTKNLSTLKLWGRILSKLKVDEKHKIVWSTITKKDLADAHAVSDETGGIIDELLSNAPDSEIVILLKHKEEGAISGSIRTPNPAIDASVIAEMFGGGGHVQAAGFKVETENMDEVEKAVLIKVREFQEKRHNTVEAFEYKEVKEEKQAPTKALEESSNGKALQGLPKGSSKVIQRESHPTGESSNGKPKQGEAKKETQKEEKPKREETKQESLKSQSPKEEAESFTDFVIKANMGDEETNIEEGMIYKFEE